MGVLFGRPISLHLLYAPAPVGGKDLRPPMWLWTYCLRDLPPSSALSAGLTAKGLWPSPTSVVLLPPGLIAFATHCLLDLCACLFRLIPQPQLLRCRGYLTRHKQATASSLLSVRVMGTFFQLRRLKVPSRESNPSLFYECWCYHSIAGLNRLLACSVKFVLKFPELAWNVQDFLSKFFFSRPFYSATSESFGSIISPKYRLGNSSIYAAI